MNKAEIRREVMRATSTYTAQDLFASQYFKEMLQATVTSVCQSLGRVPVINTICEPRSSLTAATDGLVITQNTQGPLIKDLDTNWKQYISNIGHTVHETGHILFTDFKSQNKLKEYWVDGDKVRFFPEKPKGKETEKVLKILNDCPNIRLVYCSAMIHIENLIEDAYIENRLRENFSGLAIAGLELVNRVLYDQCPALSEYLDSVISGQCMPIQVASSLMLIKYVCKSEVKLGLPLNEEQQKLYEFIKGVLDSLSPVINSLLTEQDGLKRCRLFNTLFIKLFVLMPMPESKPESEGQGGEKGGEQAGKHDGEENHSLGQPGGEKSSENGVNKPSDISNDARYMAIKQMKDERKRIGQSEEPKGVTSSVKPQPIEESAEEKRKTAELLSQSESSMQRELDSALKDAAYDQVLRADEIQHEKELQKEIREIMDNAHRMTGKVSFNGYSLSRPLPDKTEYEKVYSEVSKSANNLARKINNILKDRETDSVESGFLMGQRFNAKDVARRDGKYFSRQMIPDGKPDVVFGILIDESGSMKNNSKRETAAASAVLLESALRSIGTPFIIVGHNESGKCNIHSFSDFNTNDGKDKYRLTRITAKGCNIDGAAITYVGEKLLKRPEKIKVLIVISDGLPTGASFYSSNCKMDTKMAVEHFRRKGVKVFGAVVDSFEEVSSIYGKDYSFDCRSSGALEAQLIRLIKKYVLLRG